MITPTQLRETRLSGLACASFMLCAAVCWVTSAVVCVVIFIHGLCQ